jgi:hypothetical protein
MSSTMIQQVRHRPLAPAAFVVMCIVMCMVVVSSASPAATAAEGLPVSPPSRAEQVRFVEDIQPVLAANCPIADREGVERILGLSLRLELCWLAVGLLVCAALVSLDPAWAQSQ